MERERDYAALIPAGPPDGLLRFLREKEERLCDAVLAFRPIAREDAEAELLCEECAGDCRPRWERPKGRRTALLWCSACERTMLAEYLREEGCGRYGGPPAGIALAGDLYQKGGSFAEGSELHCPYCGAAVTLRSAAGLRYGDCEQAFVAELRVAQAPAGEDGGSPERLPVLTVWCVERRIYWKRQQRTTDPAAAWFLDGGTLVKLVRYRRYMNRLCRLERWERLKQARDNLGAPLFYDRFPDLGGTALENAKLPEYYAQAYETGDFWPLGYIRLYLKRPNAENLVTAGLGRMVGDAIRREAGGGTGGYRQARLRWVDWKEARPSRMLGLTREQLRQARAAGWKADGYRLWRECAGRMRFEALAEAMALAGPDAVWRMLEEGEDPLRTARYLRRQGDGYPMLLDYRRMADRAGMDLTREEVRWPARLREAHDRALAAVRYHTSEAQRRAFAAMSARCAGLCWERDGVCIRPAATPEELVAEGAALHHCVGGYAGSHAAGKIILFIRHSRRPERSWFTLNVDVKSKQVLQLHGYGNERSPKGKRLTIPRQVREFVEQWEREVLKPWRLPAQRKANRLPGKAPARGAA